MSSTQQQAGRVKHGKGEVVILDYQSFENHDFEGCVLVFKGGRPPRLIGCTFTECTFDFSGEAGNTLEFLRGFAADPSGSGGKEFVKQLLGL